VRNVQADENAVIETASNESASKETVTNGKCN